MKFGAVVLIWLLLLSAFSAAGQKTVQSAPELENSSAAAAAGSKVEREVFDAVKHPPLTAVGRINFIGGSWCTIILVAEDVAVTAGHCFTKANYKFDLKKDFDPSWTSVNFKPDGVRRLEGVSVRRVLAVRLDPDYAIVRLNKKIPETEIKPLRFESLTLDEIRADETLLGCAGFNGDRELGSGGLLLTLSRNVKIIPENSSKGRIDVNCFSTYGGSGGLFYRQNAAGETVEYDFLGVVWGLTDEKTNERGELVRIEEVITSVTPVSVFYEELKAIIEKKDEKPKNGKIRTENKRDRSER